MTKQSVLALWALGIALTGCKHEPAVVCHVTYGGEEQLLRFEATRAPYRVEPRDISGRYRFKAVYVRQPWSAASINLYVYDSRASPPRILQQSCYLPPFSAPDSSGSGFTGLQMIYSSGEHELHYWCELSP